MYKKEVRAPFLLLSMVLLFAGVIRLAQAEVTPTATKPIDARAALPFAPAPGAQDWLYMRSPDIPDLGVHIKVLPFYSRQPFGVPEGQYYIANRFALYLQGMISIKHIFEAGVSMPFVIYQNTDAPDFNSSSWGDLRAEFKLSLPIKALNKFLKIGIGGFVGFATAGEKSYMGAGQTSGSPQLLLQTPSLFGRIAFNANLGAVITGTAQPCPPNTADPAAANCLKGKGLGNHFLYGVGASARVGERIHLTTEFVGSVPFGLPETFSPIVWSIGMRSLLTGGTYFSASYSLGLSNGSPAHTAFIGLGFLWEDKPKPSTKPAGPPPAAGAPAAPAPTGASTAPTTPPAAAPKDGPSAATSSAPTVPPAAAAPAAQQAAPTAQPDGGAGGAGSAQQAVPVANGSATKAVIQLPDGMRLAPTR